MPMSTSTLTQNRNRREWITAQGAAVCGSLWLRWSAGMVVAALAPVTLMAIPVEAAVVEDWKLNPSTGQVEVLLPEGITPKLSVLSQAGRLVLDLPQVEVGINITEFYEDTLVRQVSLTQVDDQTARITVDFVPGVGLDAQEVELRQIGVDNLWVVRPGVLSLPQSQPLAEPMTPSIQQVITETETETETAVETVELEATTQQAVEPPPPPGTTVIESEFEPFPAIDVVQVPLDEPKETELFPEGTIESDMTEEGTEGETEVAVEEAEDVQVIPYGQPIPKASEQQTITFRPQTIDQRPPNLLLQAGDTLTLRYPIPVERPLRAYEDDLDVLLLQGGIVDKEGKFIVPPDTPVIGRFESSRTGTRFVAVGINLDDRTIPISAESDKIKGDLDIDPEKVAIDSGIGGLGVFLLSGFSGLGLLIGAVGGAAFGLGTSPKPVTIQPGQIIEVQLYEDVPKSDFVYYDAEQVPYRINHGPKDSYRY